MVVEARIYLKECASGFEVFVLIYPQVFGMRIFWSIRYRIAIVKAGSTESWFICSLLLDVRFSA